MKTHTAKHFRPSPAANLALMFLLMLLVVLGAPRPAQAALTDLASEPLATLSGTPVKPNILFVLDNSGSMGWDYMPDDVKDAVGNAYKDTYGYKSAHCNGVAYDPAYTYTPPLNADGTYMANASFSAANPNGYGPSLAGGKAYYSDTNVQTGAGSKTFEFSGGFFAGFDHWLSGLPPWNVGDKVTAVDLDDENHWVIGTITSINRVGDPLCLLYCKATMTITVTSYNGTESAKDWQVNKLQVDNLANSTYYVYTGSQPKMNWAYTADNGLTNNAFKQECVSKPGNPANEPGDGKFTGVVVNANSSEAQNYANWYQYYRTRMLMMRSAAGRAFQPLSDQYRVGFTTINATDTVERTALKDISSGKAFLNVRDYNSTQRALFIERLYNTSANGGTPLRPALSRAGQYYAKKIAGQTHDPVQYSCQRNYVLLSTDGYWNGGTGKQLNGSTDVGQQDGADVRPFSDGATVVSRTVTKEIERKETRTEVKVSQNFTRTDYTYVNSTSSPCSFLSSVKRTNKPYTASVSVTGNKVQVQDWVTTTTETTTTVAGSATSTTDTVGPVMSVVSNSAPTVSTPAASTGSPWVAGAESVSCQGAFAAKPASTGVSASGGPVETVIGQTVTATVSNTTSGPTTTVVSSTGGASNTLADVAQYYYKTDLRTPELGNCTAGAGGSGDVCDNSRVTPAGRDTATWQHMTTFTLGLGVNGTLPYDRNYLDRATDPASSYYKLIKGDLNWPVPKADDATTIDDLWHAAVNGRGQYFGARNATDLTQSLTEALTNMGSQGGSARAPAVISYSEEMDTPLIFGTSYTTIDWTGDMVPHHYDRATDKKTPLPGTGQAGVDSLARRSLAQTDRRSIYYGTSASTTVKAFNATNLAADQMLAPFEGFCTKSVTDSGAAVLPAQCAGLTAAQKTLANTGAPLVNWLRGHVDHEASNTANPLFRRRTKVLGDIVNSQALYVGRFTLSYADEGYAAYVATQSSRKPMVFAGANDGMLHAFSAGASDMGKELWAFVPNEVMSRMPRLANTDYANRHQYLVDGSPVVGHIRRSTGAWHTVLLGGLNSGGKAVYALDITTPASPKKLWEYTDTDLGYTHGNPLLTKLPSGRWVAVFASGYNNTGKGYVYVLDAYTGARLAKIATTAGDAATPSGLAHLNVRVRSYQDNTALAIYGGDLLGNVWRFNLTEAQGGAVSGSAQRLAQLRISATVPQSITSRPELATITSGGTRYPLVLVGTGRYLGSTDVSDTTVQSIYAFKDTGADLGDLRAGGQLRVVTATVTDDGHRDVSAGSVDWATQNGWRLDLPLSGERVFNRMHIVGPALVASAVVPGSTGLCTAASGRGWDYPIDVLTGGKLPGWDYIGYPTDGTPVGYMLVKNEDGSETVVICKSDGNCTSNGPPIPNSGSAQPSLKRTSWRELFTN